MPNPFDVNHLEDRSWHPRYRKISRILSSLDEDVKLEITYEINKIIDEYFMDFPAVKNYVEYDIRSKELYYFLIPIAEDVLKLEGLFDED